MKYIQKPIGFHEFQKAHNPEIQNLAGWLMRIFLCELGTQFYGDLCKNFKCHGRPSNSKKVHAVGFRLQRADPENDKYLLSTGKFVISRNGKALTFSEAFCSELFSAWPERKNSTEAFFPKGKALFHVQETTVLQERLEMTERTGSICDKDSFKINGFKKN